jgi:opacity protein-like surface antigen
MQKLLGLFAVIILFTLPARAQDSTTQEAQKEPEKKQETPKEEGKPEEALEKQKPQQITPKYELEGGYTYRSFYPPNAPRFGMNGWNATFDYNWKHWIGFVVDGTGTHKDKGLDGKTSIYTFLVGPRIYPFGHRHRLIPFGGFLLGAGHETLNIPSQGGFPQKTFTSTAYAWAVGGGLDVRVTKHWAVRVIEFDYEKTRFTDFTNVAINPSESNRRISIGIVFRWGEAK